MGGVAMAEVGKAKALAAGLWLVLIVEAFGMLLAGSAKFTAAGWWSAKFVEWGYPEGFSHVVGVVEMAGAGFLFAPALAAYAAIVLIVVMVSALVTVLTNPGRPTVDGPLIHLVLLGLILAARWRRRWRPGRSRHPG